MLFLNVQHLGTDHNSSAAWCILNTVGFIAYWTLFLIILDMSGCFSKSLGKKKDVYLFILLFRGKNSFMDINAI